MAEDFERGHVDGHRRPANRAPLVLDLEVMEHVPAAVVLVKNLETAEATALQGVAKIHSSPWR